MATAVVVGSAGSRLIGCAAKGAGQRGLVWLGSGRGGAAVTATKVRGPLARRLGCTLASPLLQAAGRCSSTPAASTSPAFPRVVVSRGAAAATTTTGAYDWVVVGLRNPHAELRGTRHNAGAMLVEAMARSLGATSWTRSKRGRASVAEATVSSGNDGNDSSHRVLFALPTVAMNDSGVSVAALNRLHRVAPSRLLLVYDDMDTPLGHVRLRGRGGHGGHNGMRSILKHLATCKDAPRLRVGIGRPARQSPDAVLRHVLSKFDKRNELPRLQVVIDEAPVLLGLLLSTNIARACSTYGTWPPLP